MPCIMCSSAIRRLDPALIVERCRPSSSVLDGRVGRIVGLRQDCLEVQRRLLATLRQGRLFPKRRRRRCRPDADPVLRHQLEGQHALLHEHRQDVGHQRVEGRPLMGAKPRKSMMPDLDVPDDPAEAVVALRERRDLTRAADPTRHRVQPQGELHPCRDGGATPLALHRLHVGEELREVDRADHVPQDPRRVRARQHVVRDLEPDHALRSIRLLHTQLPGTFVFHSSATGPGRADISGIRLFATDLQQPQPSNGCSSSTGSIVVAAASSGTPSWSASKARS